MFVFFEHHHARAFAHHEAVAILVVGTRGLFRRVVERCRQSTAGIEARDAEAADRRLRAAGDHDIRIAKHNETRGIADSVRAGRAGRDHVPWFGPL